MNPGQLKHRIIIEQFSEIENTLLEKTKQWIPFKKVWAQIKCVGNAREQIKSKEQLKLNYEIIIRYTAGVTTAMRVRYKDKTFNINHVVNYNELNRELHLFCTEVEEGVYNE